MKNCLELLPREIIDEIIIYTRNPVIAVLFRSDYAYTKLSKRDHHARMDTMKTLCKHGCIKQLYWLYMNKVESADDILNICMTEGSLRMLRRLTSLFPSIMTQETSISRLFQSSLHTCNIDKVRYILDTGYIPVEIQDPRPLRLCPTVMNALLESLPVDLFMKQEFVSVAMESNNETFLRITEEHFDARKNMSNRDLILAARRGSLNALKWFHQCCPCSKYNYARCILDECIYNAGMQSRQGDIIEWLRNETNCALRMMGYPRLGYPRLGYMNGFGYGDLSDGGRGFVWFMR